MLTPYVQCVHRAFLLVLKMKKYFVILFLSFALNKAYSQNLVPNSGFENYTQCALSYNFIYYAFPWFQPANFLGNTTNSSSSDLFDTCSNHPIFPPIMGIPRNELGYQTARTGVGYAGIIVHYESGNNYREYIEVKLNDTLVANKKYCVEFYVSLADSAEAAISNMGAFFSTDSLLDNRFGHLAIDYVSPQIENHLSNMLNDTLNWMLVSGSFIAAGGERFMTIGNFHLPANTNSQSLSPIVYFGAYYYIDDISVIYCDPSVVEEMEIQDVEISPNPATNEIMLTSNQKLKTIHIYNVLGEEVLKLERIATSEKAIDISLWKAGVYFVKVETEKGVVRKKVVKE